MRLVKLLCAGIAVLSIAAAPLWAAEAAVTAPTPAGAAEVAQPPQAQGEVRMRPELKMFDGIRAWRVNGEEIPIGAVQERALMAYGPYVLQDMVVERLLLQEAKRRGVTVSDAEVDAKMRDIRTEQGLNTDEALDRFLRLKQTTLQAFRASARDYVYIEKLFAGQIFVSDDEVTAFYNQNRELYRTPETVVYRWFVAGSEAGAQQALGELRKGRDFVTVAKEMTADPRTRAFAGETETHQRGTNPAMPKDFEEALFKAPLGQAYITKVGATSAVIRVEKRTAAQEVSLEQAREQIKRDIRRMKLEQAVFPGWISTQLAAAEIIPIPASGTSAAK